MKHMATGLTKTDLDSDVWYTLWYICVCQLCSDDACNAVIIEQANKFSFITSYYSVAIFQTSLKV